MGGGGGEGENRKREREGGPAFSVINTSGKYFNEV